MIAVADGGRERLVRLRPGGIAIGLICLLGSMIVAVAMGAVSLPAGGIARELIDRLPFVSIDSGLSEREVAILWELRMPRVVLGGLVGASLAMSGAAYQGVFRNALADPYLLGAAAGAGLGATLVFAYIDDSSSWPIDPLPLAAFVGALVSVLLTYILGRSGGRSRSATTLILAGVAMASFLTAVQTYFQQRESDTLQQVYAWILGRLSTSGWREVGLILPYVLLSGIGILLHRRLLDVMSVGDEEAGSLGIERGACADRGGDRRDPGDRGRGGRQWPDRVRRNHSSAHDPTRVRIELPLGAAAVDPVRGIVPDPHRSRCAHGVVPGRVADRRHHSVLRCAVLHRGAEIE